MSGFHRFVALVSAAYLLLFMALGLALEVTHPSPLPLDQTATLAVLTVAAVWVSSRQMLEPASHGLAAYRRALAFHALLAICLLLTGLLLDD